MKKFFKVTVLLTLLLLRFPAAAEEKPTVILNLEEKPQSRPVSLEETVTRFLDSAKYFEQKYPGELIDGDIHEDIARHHPEFTPQEVYDYQQYLRGGMKVYRYISGLIDKYKQALITPEEPPLVADDSEYDLSSPDFDYIDADGTVVVQDFKKIISYSQNPREIKAYRAKFASEGAKTGKMKDFEELGHIFSRLELKKILFYDIFYDNPLTGNRGIGKWQTKDDFKIRLITVQSGVNEKQKTEGLLHLLIPDGYFITAVDSAQYMKPEIRFDNSENLKKAEYTLPLPARLAGSREDWTVYVGETAVPFTAEAADPSRSMTLRADVKLNLCRSKSQCETVRLTPELQLQPGHTRDSSVATYVRMMSGFLRPQQQSELKIGSFSLKEMQTGGQVLTLTVDSPETIESFNIFVGNDAGLAFERPRVRIDGSRATVRLLPLDDKSDAEGKEFEITIEANRKYVLRQTLSPVRGNAPEPDRRNLLTAMFAAAVIGGLLLNFMPCVFPVLSLKLLSLTKFGARNVSSVRRSFAFTLLGIWLSFALLAVMLAGLKQLGENVGWGMQFQNPWFVSLIFFAVLLFVAQIWGIVEISIPRFFCRTTDSENRLLHFLTGIFAVLMATPCTAPYLGTAIGFALAGNYVDIFVILGGVALGLSLPYLLLWLFPGLALILPPPGGWMKNVSRFMLFMLMLTLFWLLHIAASQSGWWPAVRLAVYALLFWLFLWLRHLSLNLDYESLPPAVRKKAADRMGLIFAVCAFLVFAGASVDNHYAAARKEEQIRRDNLASITMEKVGQYVREGKTVIVTVSADWCLTCRFNDIMVFENPAIKQKIQNRGVVMLNVDWTVSNSETAEFMKKFGRSGLPFYVLFSPLVPDGMVLPEILSEQELKLLIDNMSLFRPNS